MGAAAGAAAVTLIGRPLPVRAATAGFGAIASLPVNAPPSLEARDLCVRHGRRVALDVPELAVRPGEVLALLGPNGAGKSTLLRCLALLQRPTTGAVLFRGAALSWSDAVAYRRRTATLLQDPVLFDTTVYENVAAGLRLRGVPRAAERRRVGEWLDRLGIAHLCDRLARTLSGGEARRVSLARAMVLEPEALFLDEPCAGLDAPTRAGFVRQLVDLLDQRRVTTVFVTHDQAEARALADRVAVLVEGAIAQVGPAAGVLDGPAQPCVAAFLHAGQLPPARWLASAGADAPVG
ncbi:MAG TPA: ATP-binding cassette domain-containing protein [Chloroflexota bacterium]|nr:ATP-binding cassette domain-containing protein [Chloroflexota bacterium]